MRGNRGDVLLGSNISRMTTTGHEVRAIDNNACGETPTVARTGDGLSERTYRLDCTIRFLLTLFDPLDRGFR